MSVTFSVTMQHDEAIAWNLTCEVTGRLNDAPLTWERASEVTFAHKVTCPDEVCQQYGPDKDEVRLNGVRSDLDVNVSNSHAAYLLDALGLDTDDLCGALPAQDFLGRCLVAEAVAPADPGTPTYVATPQDASGLSTLAAAFTLAGATVIVGGRPEGYLHDKMVRLIALAEYAQSVGSSVSWA